MENQKVGDRWTDRRKYEQMKWTVIYLGSVIREKLNAIDKIGGLTCVKQLWIFKGEERDYKYEMLTDLYSCNMD